MLPMRQHAQQSCLALGLRWMLWTQLHPNLLRLRLTVFLLFLARWVLVCWVRGFWQLLAEAAMSDLAAEEAAPSVAVLSVVDASDLAVAAASGKL